MYHSALFRRFEQALTYLAQEHEGSLWLSGPNPEAVSDETARFQSLLCSTPASPDLLAAAKTHLAWSFGRFGLNPTQDQLQGMVAFLSDAKDWPTLVESVKTDPSIFRNRLFNHPATELSSVEAVAQAQRAGLALLEYPDGSIAPALAAVAADNCMRPFRLGVNAKDRSLRVDCVAGIVQEQLTANNVVFLLDGAGDYEALCDGQGREYIDPATGGESTFGWLATLEGAHLALTEDKARQFAQLWAEWFLLHTADAGAVDGSLYLRRLITRWLTRPAAERTFAELARNVQLWRDSGYSEEEVQDFRASYLPGAEALAELRGRTSGVSLSDVRLIGLRAREATELGGIRGAALFALCATACALSGQKVTLVVSDSLGLLQRAEGPQFLSELVKANRYDGAVQVYADSCLDRIRRRANADEKTRHALGYLDARLEMDATNSEYPVHAWVGPRGYAGGPCRLKKTCD